MTDKGILLIEDDEVDVMNVKRAFKKLNFNRKLHIARNGKEALFLLKNKNGSSLKPFPKVAILDINMPIMNGIDFLKELRKDEELKDMVVFVLSGSDEKSDIESSYSMNVAGYFVKPISFDKFVDTTKKVTDYINLIDN